MVAIDSNGQTIFNFTHIENITLGADEEVYEATAKWHECGQDRLEGSQKVIEETRMVGGD